MITEKEYNQAVEQLQRAAASDYWKERCEAAEAYIETDFADPDITPKRLAAYNHWLEIKSRVLIPENKKPKEEICDPSVGRTIEETAYKQRTIQG